MENVKRVMEGLYKLQFYSATLTEKEVDYWLANYSDLVICQGHVRKVVFTPITKNTYKVTSEAV